MKSIKTALTNNQENKFFLAALILSIAGGNMILQFLLRFLLTGWFRIVWISVLVFLLLFPLVFGLLKKTWFLLPPKPLDRYVLFGLSLIISALF